MDPVDELYKALADPTRRKILELLSGGPLSYTEIMGALETKSTGKLNYHLKILGNLIQKDSEGKYTLTEQGMHAVELLRGFRPQDQAMQPQNSGKGGSTQTIMVIAGIVLILIGVFVVFAGISMFLAFLVFAPSFSSVASFGEAATTPFIFNLTPNTTQYVQSIQPNGNFSFHIEWSAPAPVELYALNSSQFDTFFFRNGSFVMNHPVKGTPTSYLAVGKGSSGQLDFTAQAPIYLAVSANQSVYLALSVSGTTTPQKTHTAANLPLMLFAILVLGLGAFMIYFGITLIRRNI